MDDIFFLTVLKAAAGTAEGGCAVTCAVQQCGMKHFYRVLALENVLCGTML